MSTAMTIFDSPKLTVPAHISAFLETESNIPERQTVPSLGYGGKVWTISKDGEKIKMTRRNEDGEEETLQTIKVIILDYAKHRGRAYYDGPYDPDKIGRPVCWSEDGLHPDKTVQNPQAANCKECPMAAKGSKITEQGKSVTACASHRIIVVVPAAQPTSTPLRCKLAITSLYDKQSPDLEKANWRAFEQYIDFLRALGVTHTATVVTKMKFDPNTDYPKIIFSPDRWLEPNELATIAPIVKSTAVTSLLDGTFTINGVDGVKVDDSIDTDMPFELSTTAPVSSPQKSHHTPTTAPIAEALTATKTKTAKIPTQEKPAQVPAQETSVATTSDIPDDVKQLLADWAD